ncbi:hypothetical protein [Allokutzneria sp. NRRL B-24872]|uniref:hypothetical protein n=1 Tax=Allokutzneria sp. NRRL B-24872 TaxID=1137961 RepID=UPI000A366C03|nr:hypothetical protein [Allokutzneria sp. NRRL B-24872]
MRVRYNPFLGTVLVVLGVLCVFLGGWLTLLGEFTPTLVVGAVTTFVGVLQLTRPYFVVTPASVVVPSLIGPLKREIPYARLVFEDGKLFALGEDGVGKRLPVSRLLANSRDWESVVPH